MCGPPTRNTSRESAHARRTVLRTPPLTFRKSQIFRRRCQTQMIANINLRGKRLMGYIVRRDAGRCLSDGLWHFGDHGCTPAHHPMRTGSRTESHRRCVVSGVAPVAGPTFASIYRTRAPSQEEEEPAGSGDSPPRREAPGFATVHFASKAGQHEPRDAKAQRQGCPARRKKGAG